MTGEVKLILVGLGVGIPLAIAPGAVIVRTIRALPKSGVGAGARAAAGGLLADALAIAVLTLVAFSPPEFLVRGGRPGTVVGLAAAVVLLVAGFRLMDRKVVGVLDRDQKNGEMPSGHSSLVVDRFTATIANPWWHLFWWTVGLCILIEAAGLGMAGIGIFAAAYLVPGLLWPTFVALRLAEPEREKAIADRQYRILTSLGGLVLVAVGFISGASALAGSGVHEVFERAVETLFG